MTIDEYLDTVKGRLLTDPMLSGFRVIRERATLTDGHLRARLTLTDGNQIEFSEYVQRSPDGQVNIITYSFHWADVHGNLIRRWDNTPHFPNLPGFPHHIHDGPGGAVGPGQPVSLSVVLDVIARQLA